MSRSNYVCWVNVTVLVLFMCVILKSSSSSWWVVVVDAAATPAPPLVPCFFIFGDSLSDGGNNNNLISLAKANFLPYGIDFPGGPRATGRFGNGLMTVDFINEKLGLPGYRPPFYKARDPKQALLGVNYASGSAGILAETGNVVGGRIRMDKQLQNHEKTISRIKGVMGSNTTKHLQKCLYSIWVGSNDWMLNYFMIPTVKPPPPRLFSNKLVRKLSQQFQKLYQLGARKVVLFGLGPLGCLPSSRVLGQCNGIVNSALQMYNEKLKQLASQMTSKHKDLKISYIDTMGIYTPDLSGLPMKVKGIACCGGLTLACLPLTIPCVDRKSYVHWDNAHPTEGVNKILADRAFNAKKPSDATPMDITQLLKQ